MAIKIEDMTPAQAAMYAMSGGYDREQATRRSRKINKEPMNPRTDRMQKSLDDLAEAMEKMREAEDS